MPPDHRSLYKEMLIQFREKLQRYKLQEGFKSSEDFDISKVINPSSINKWSNKSNKEVFKAAKKGDKTALEYLFWRMKGAITNAFWKRFLGPSGTIRKYRIDHENAWEEWLGIAWMAMAGGFDEAFSGTAKSALESFNPDSVDEDKMMNVFAGRFKLILGNAALSANTAKKRSGLVGVPGEAEIGVSQYEPTWTEGKDDSWSDDEIKSSHGHKDDTFEEMYTGSFKDVEDKMESDEFLKKWRRFVQDPDLHKPQRANRRNEGGASVTPADILGEIIGNTKASFPEMTKQFGIARNSIAALLERAQKIMDNYEVSNQELMTAIKYLGNDKVASYLKINDSPLEEKPKLKSKNNSDFIERFKKGMEHNKMWSPSEKGLDAANVILWWIHEGFPEINDLAEEYGYNKARTRWFWRRAMQFLAKVGIDDGDIRTAVQTYGKKKIMKLIGVQK